MKSRKSMRFCISFAYWLRGFAPFLLLLFLTNYQARSQNILLEVEEPDGIPRKAEPVTSGIPLQIPSQQTDWSLWDGNQEIPVQITALPGRTPWILVDFQVSLAPFEKRSFTLKKIPPSSNPKQTLTITEDSKQIIVNTGPLRILIGKDPFNLISRVWLDRNSDNAFSDNEQILAPNENNIIIQDATSGTIFDGKGKPDSIKWEIKGPLRATLRVDGRYRNGFQEYISYTTRFTFYAGKKSIKVEHILKNSCKTNKRHVKIRSATLRFGIGTNYYRSDMPKYFNWINVTKDGAVFELIPKTMTISYVNGAVDVDQNGGWILPDLTDQAVSIIVDFSPDLNSTEKTVRERASQSPLFALAPSSWYSEYGYLSTSKFGTLEDEQRAYEKWGWSWSANQVPHVSHKNNVWIAWKDVHGDLESDDLWQHIIMYLRTRNRGYWDRALGWAHYFMYRYPFRTHGFSFAWNTSYEYPKIERPEISIPLTSYDEKFLNNDVRPGKVDADMWGACHLWAWGLIDFYYLTGSLDALEAAVDICEVSERILGYWKPGPYKSFGNGYNVYDAGVRQEARHLLSVTRVYEATLDEHWYQYMNHIAELILKSNGWDNRGMFVWSTRKYPKIFSSYHFGLLNHAFYQYYLVTKNNEVFHRLIQMANFAKNYAMHPVWKYCGYRIALDYPDSGQIWHTTLDDGGLSGFTPISTISFIDALIRGFRLTGENSYLERAKFFWDRASKAVYGNPMVRTAGENEVGRFLNSLFRDPYFDNNGDLPYAHLLFYDEVHNRPSGFGERRRNSLNDIRLLRNFPNPFNSSTVIKLVLPEDAEVSLRIYNIQGRLVEVVRHGKYPAGKYDITWGDGKTSGIYFCSLKAKSKKTVYSSVRKMVLLK